MKLKRKHLCAASLLLALNMTAVRAATIGSISYDVDTNTVTIDGSGTPNKKVTLEILNRGVKTEDLKNVQAKDIGKYLYRIDQTKADEEGNFTFTFKMDGSDDEFVTRVNVDGIAEGVLVCVGAAEYEAAMLAFNQAGTIDEIMTAIDTHGAAIGLSNTYYGLLGNAQRNVAQAVLNEKNSLAANGEKFKKAAQILSPYNEAVLIEAMKLSKTDSRIDAVKLAEENESILKLSELKIYELYKSFTQEQKAEVMKGVSENCDTVEKIRTAFAEKTALAGVKNTVGYSNLYSLLIKYNDVYILDFTNYDAISDFNKTRVMQALEGKSYASLTDLRTAFNDAVSNNRETFTGGSSGGSGGSGGGTASISPGAALNGQTSSAKPFNDIENYAWAEESIIALYNKNVISGRGNGEFAPADYVKREEFVKMLICAINAGTGANTDRFTDVDGGAWYAGYVNKALELELISGITEDSFGTGMNITRQDIAVILARCAELKGVTLPAKKNAVFTDAADISEYARDAVKMLADAGIINGSDNGEFAPKRFATRAETARLIFEFLKYIQ